MRWGSGERERGEAEGARKGERRKGVGEGTRRGKGDEERERRRGRGGKGWDRRIPGEGIDGEGVGWGGD